MSYGDRPYITERPDELRRRWESCPPAGLVRAQAPDWHLQRWKVTRDLIVGWYGDDRPDDEAVPDIVESRAGWLDPVQRSVVERLFAGWRAMFPKEAGVMVDLEPPATSVFDHERGLELRVTPTIGLARPDGTVEHVRLRTGVTSSGPDDAAVLNADPSPSVANLDALVAAGVAEEVPVPPDVEQRVAQLLDLAARDRRVREQPGTWCFSCSSSARCVRYPLLDEGRVYVSTRAVTVSKTGVGDLDVCERRVAWDRVHQVPASRDGEWEPAAGLRTGLRFHEMAASALMSDDPAAVLAAARREVDPAEAAELERLWDNHRRLWREDGDPPARAVEHPAGVTFLVPGIHVDSRGRESTRDVAVTLIGILDVTGREPDGTPMVVEHRTGAASEHGHLEAELYAVAAAALVGAIEGAWPDRVAVHLHHLRPADPVCERRIFDRAGLDEARLRLRQTAGRVAGWHPLDSLDPSHQVGSWCAGCRHRPVCENFR